MVPGPPRAASGLSLALLAEALAGVAVRVLERPVQLAAAVALGYAIGVFACRFGWPGGWL